MKHILLWYTSSKPSANRFNISILCIYYCKHYTGGKSSYYYAVGGSISLWTKPDISLANYIQCSWKELQFAMVLSGVEVNGTSAPDKTTTATLFKSIVSVAGLDRTAEQTWHSTIWTIMSKTTNQS